MLVIGLCLLWFGLLVIDRIFQLHWKEFTMGVTLLALVICVSCLIHHAYIASTIFAINTLLEYKKYIEL